MNFETMFPSKWLRAADLPPDGLVATIASVKTEEIGRSQEEKPIVRFSNVSKALVLNHTNGKAIAAIYGKDVNNWISADVLLVRAQTEMGGETVDCIRVRRPTGVGKSTTQAARAQDHQRPLQRRTGDADMPERIDADLDDRIPF